MMLTLVIYDINSTQSPIMNSFNYFQILWLLLYFATDLNKGGNKTVKSAKRYAKVRNNIIKMIIYE